jgi:hypothetical protein
VEALLFIAPPDPEFRFPGYLGPNTDADNFGIVEDKIYPA